MRATTLLKIYYTHLNEAGSVHKGKNTNDS